VRKTLIGLLFYHATALGVSISASRCGGGDPMDRRDFLKLSAALAASGFVPSCSFRREPHANETGIGHILPTVSHDRALLKVSFHDPHDEAPSLRVDGREVRGVRTDSRGRFWSFDVNQLRASSEYELTLTDAAGRWLHGPWALSTFPLPTARPRSLRLLVFTCAGGHEALRDYSSPKLERIFQTTQVRTRLLERGLAFEPDAVVANGDHVYWDLQSAGSIGLGRSPFAWWVAGRFDRDAPVGGTENEAVLHRAVIPQIVDLYGTRCQSVPVFFLRDDHDYFENDEASERLVTFPPDPFMMELARATQHMYYPEFLPDGGRPEDLPGASAPDRPAPVSESFGTLRYGKLLELLLYDCCGFISLAAEGAGLVPASVEQWILSRVAARETDHVVQMPSTPPGWSAGKWLEWYPDVLDEEEGRLVTSRPKPYWQPGWRAQHDRLLSAASGMPGRIPLFLGGDLHCIAAGRITRSGRHDWRRNPVVSILPGAPGTSTSGWPSSFRGVDATPPSSLEVEEIIPPIEENGFVLADFTPTQIELRFFRWHPSQGVDAIPTLEPFHRLRLTRPRPERTAREGDG
jgi:hypothetical protein